MHIAVQLEASNVKALGLPVGVVCRRRYYGQSKVAVKPVGRRCDGPCFMQGLRETSRNGRVEQVSCFPVAVLHHIGDTLQLELSHWLHEVVSHAVKDLPILTIDGSQQVQSFQRPGAAALPSCIRQTIVGRRERKRDQIELHPKLRRRIWGRHLTPRSAVKCVRTGDNTRRPLRRMRRKLERVPRVVLH